MKQQTSINAYYTINDIGARQKAVYEVIKCKVLACNIDIAEELNLPINSITPRTNELVRMGLVEEGKKSIGPTGRVVIFWKIKNKESKIDWEKMRLQSIYQRGREVNNSSNQNTLF